ncbi:MULTISPECIES: hypothetical protein [Streptomyces]|uniref:Secreted protein n=1 Tax=Streptomyces drozdowiczii TaxID=202862 RepID=A0ABY6PWQ7_9ACTN|nr:MULTISPECIES: hypothetical protein [Streptomyces]MCX0243925.1 hypothetical protein [Streptomyces drozdowiczii]OKJ76209.1 hypothetical protein AMK30_08215 [Streptomyces sp. CB02460]UZK56226.1 hypothetical protein NEH16_20900 [Streptomyces drozdowiczii]
MTRGTEGHARGARRGLRRHAVVLALATALALVVGGAVAGSADAASVCAGRPKKTVKFATGELRVYKSRAYACVTAVAAKPGKRRPMSVTIQPRGGLPVTDSGRFTQLAGPVTVHALNRCVRVSGKVDGKGARTGWILC